MKYAPSSESDSQGVFRGAQDAVRRFQVGVLQECLLAGAFSQAARELLPEHFARHGYSYETSWRRSGGGPAVLQEPCSNSTLGFADL